MASIFNSLHIGYSGLNAAQVGIDVTGHNIANAEVDGYSRQRVVTAAATPLYVHPGSVGNGTSITEIVRVFDQFVFNRLGVASQNKEHSDILKKNLEELSTYFPDIDGVGIKNDIQDYFNMWQSLANNPDNSALKVALSTSAQTMVQHIDQTRSQVKALQDSLNQQVKSNIDEVNRIAKEISSINIEISKAEAGGIDNANDLRDKRNELELTLKKLVGANITNDQIITNNVVNSNIAIKDGSYTIQVGGFNIVDGGTFHPIGIDNTTNKNGYFEIYYERQDGVKVPFAEKITEGKVGALLELRGSTINSSGEFEDGFLQETINNLDNLARGIIESTNNLYASGATKLMQSNVLDIPENTPLQGTDLNISSGSFDIVIYDLDGNKVATRTINIDHSTKIYDTNPADEDSIVGQINRQNDDNDDGNALNDIDDILFATYNPTQKVFQIDIQAEFAQMGYTFAINDNGTNFAGATGVSRFFDGDSAKNISLNSTIKADSSKIKGFTSPTEGNNELALKMVELQFSQVGFGNGLNKINDTIYGFYDSLVTKVGSKTNSVIIANDAYTAHLAAIRQEFDSISKVSIDEELTNLIRYQTSYGAAAKVITTVDQMLTTLLGIKQ